MGWTTPTSTDDESARREHMTRVILLILVALAFAFSVPVFIGWVAGLFLLEDLAIILSVLLTVLAAWLITLRGGWRISRYLPILAIFALGVYGTTYAGIITTFILAHMMSILLTAMLLGDRQTWVMVILVIGTHLILGELHDRSEFAEFLTKAIPFSGLILGSAAMFLFAMHQLQSALDSVRKSARELESEILVRQQAEEKILKRNRELWLLNRVIATAASSQEINEILGIAIQEMASSLEVPQAGATLLTRDHNYLEVVAEFPKGARESALGTLIPIDGNDSTRYVMENHQPLAITDVQSDERMVAVQDLMLENKITSILILPLIVHDQVLGTIGLDSFVRREFTGDEIQLASNAALAAAQAIENAQLYQQLQRMAIHDELTELLNRRGIMEFGLREFERARRFQRGLTVIFMDIDHFKEINDQHGHSGGDAFLHNFGKLINGCVRDIDLVGRYGGDEFVVLLTETGLSEGVGVAHRLRSLIESTPVSIGPVEIRFTASLGVAELTPEMADLAELIARADTYLYKAKKAGRNRVEVACE